MLLRCFVYLNFQKNEIRKINFLDFFKKLEAKREKNTKKRGKKRNKLKSNIY